MRRLPESLVVSALYAVYEVGVPRTRRRDFCVGCRPWDFCLIGAAGMRQTEEIWEVGSGPFKRP